MLWAPYSAHHDTEEEGCITMSSSRSLAALFALTAFAAQPLLSSCELSATDAKLGGLDDLDLDDLKDQAGSVLRKLFPELSDAEIAELKVSLDLKQILALKEELEAVRKVAKEFSEALFTTAEERVEQREKDLRAHNDGFPEGLAATGQICTYDESRGRGEVRLSGVFHGKEAAFLSDGTVQLSIDGAEQAFSLECMQGGPSVDIVFLIDITGSMSNVIASVRDSVVDFVNLIEASGINGTVSVVSFQDTVGVNRGFQEPAPAGDLERSPFFKPVSIRDGSKVQALRDFIKRLEANRGADAPENLAGAIDFARNNVIGTMSNGEPNVIGDGKEDPPETAPFPALRSDKQVFVVLTDVGFHGDDRTERNSSLNPRFVPRDAATILTSLHRTGTTVHVSDPSWVDASINPKKNPVDADYWAIHTGGVGEDRVAGYSLVDLELVVVAERSGLLDITLDKILQTSCTLSFEASLSASAEVSVSLEIGGEIATLAVPLEVF